MRLELTRRTDYAVRAMLALTRRPAETLSSSQIAAATGIPAHFASQVMGDLVRAGLVRAVIGRAGGYGLALDAEDVSMLAVVVAVEGDTRRRNCVLRAGPCHGSGPCEVHAVFAEAQDALIDRLAATSLASVAADRADRA